MCPIFVPGALRGQKRASGPLELKLQKVANLDVGAGKWTQVLCKSNRSSWGRSQIRTVFRMGGTKDALETYNAFRFGRSLHALVGSSVHFFFFNEGLCLVPWHLKSLAKSGCWNLTYPGYRVFLMSDIRTLSIFSLKWKAKKCTEMTKQSHCYYYVSELRRRSGIRQRLVSLVKFGGSFVTVNFGGVH